MVATVASILNKRREYYSCSAEAAHHVHQPKLLPPQQQQTSKSQTSTQQILAFSGFQPHQTKGYDTWQEVKFNKLKSATESGRTLLSDRKGWLDHVTTPSLLKSALRIAAVQSSNMLANYLQDQLQADFAREELVKDGKISAFKADKQQEQWEQAEWDRRLKELPSKIMIGYAKFHAITMLMRCYEFIAEKIVDEFTLDRLTVDPFEMAIRTSDRTHTKGELRKQMYTTCLWSNIIAFMADYSVHQVILAYTYYRYYENKRKRRKAGEDDVDLAPLMLSYLTKSTSLIVSRGVGLFASAVGGAWGSTFYPGWGTVIGAQFCDGVVGSVFDELQPSVMKVQL